MNAIVYFNGAYCVQNQAHVSSQDRGFLLGDGVFETICAVDGEIKFYQQHYRRLRAAADIFKIPFIMPEDALRQVLCDLLVKNDLLQSRAAIRITLTRGISEMRGISVPTPILPPTILICAQYYEVSKTPISVVISPYLFKATSPLCYIKYAGYQLSILAKINAQQRGADDALFLHENGGLVGATCANVFALIDGCWLTPPLSFECRPGIVRGVVLQLAAKNKIPFAVAPMTRQQLMQAEAMFLTNSLLGIQPIHKIEGDQIDGRYIDAKHPEILKLASIYDCFYS